MSETGRSWWLWAGAAAGAAGVLYALRPSCEPAEETDFTTFLGDPAQWASPAPGSAARAAPVDDTGFDAFLRVQPAAAPVDPTGFDTFLRVAVGGPGAAAAGAAAGAKAAAAAEEVPVDRAAVAVMYGTEYGFSKEIAKKLCAKLKAGDGFWPTLINMADHPSGYDLAREQAVLMVCSTQGDGVPPTEAREFCDWLTAGGPGALPDLHYSVLALGDRSYQHFCRCGKQLDAALGAAGARPLAARVDVDKEDWAAVDAWIGGVEAALPGLGLRAISETGLGGAAAAGGGGAASAAKRFSKARPYFASVRALQGLCTITDRAADKDTVRVELDLGDSGLAYAPGDALGIYPTNPAAGVDQLLSLLRATGDELVPVPSWHYQEPEGHVTAVTGADGAPAMPLRAALTRCYDLHSPRGDALVALLAAALSSKPAGSAAVDVKAYANGSAAPTANGTANGGAAAPKAVAQQAAELARLAGDKAALESFLEPRHVVDVLRDFPAATAAITPQQLLPALRQLQPRLYSISSSPLEGAAAVQATIAVVRYAALGEDRVGVCSTFVAERTQVGDVVPVFVSKNPDFRLPKDPATPVIMVGPGTGLAPFRSFIVHRLIEAGLDPATIGAPAAAGKKGKKGKSSGGGAAAQSNGGGASGPPVSAGGPMVLYFGCRRPDQDFLYGDDLRRWAAAGAVELHTAFSRQPGQPKVYVQQRLEESADRVWELLEAGGHFYICGDANSMAGAVEAALLRIIAARLPGGEGAARAYLRGLQDSHRFERDVWFS